ncbi:MAG: carboxypeptidase regulatory-like domain-containing protein [Gemmataceae bacterium]|nr:carboxypeptidase regulatory-like domain-containing protein [Gemmataceae bacterium]
MISINNFMPLRVLRGGLSVVSSLAICALIGCGGGGGSGEIRQATAAAKGKLMIDGKPGDGAMVMFHPADKKSKSASATVDKEGGFQVSTYQAGDGLPPGEYTLTFEWPDVNPFKSQDTIPDKLKGKYKDRDNSKHKVTIDKGGKDLGVIELSTK